MDWPGLGKHAKQELTGSCVHVVAVCKSKVNLMENGFSLKGPIGYIFCFAVSVNL